MSAPYSRYRVRLYRHKLVLVREDFNPDPQTARRTWYPLVVRWWPEPRRAPGGRMDLGVIRRKSFEDRGKSRSLSRRDEVRLAYCRTLFRNAHAMACDRGLPDDVRASASGRRSSAATEIATISRRSYPKR